MKWNRHPDLALLSFLGVDEKFWKLTIPNESNSHDNAFKDVRKSISIVKDLHFVQGKYQFAHKYGKPKCLFRKIFIFILLNKSTFKAIETLQQLKTTFTPSEKMDVLLETFKEINKIGQVSCGSGFHWNMDDLVNLSKTTFIQ